MTTTTVADIAAGKKPETAVTAFSKVLDKYKPQLALALPAHLNADRMARLALTAFSNTPGLQNCEPRTIIGSLMTAAQMGLEIGVSGQGYLIPYKTTCTFVPGWQGIVDIVNRSGRATVWTGAVYEGDDFDYGMGDSPFVKHKPKGETDDPKKLTHVYACGRVNGSDWPVIDVWPIAKVVRHFKKMNKVGEKHYANTYWEMYARKIPLLQVCKYMPKSIELTNAMQMSHAAEDGTGAAFTIDATFKTVEQINPETGEIVNVEKPAAKTRKGNGSPDAHSDGLEPGKTYAQYASSIQAGSLDEIDLEIDEAKNVLPADQYEELRVVYKRRKEQLG